VDYRSGLEAAPSPPPADDLPWRLTPLGGRRVRSCPPETLGPVATSVAALARMPGAVAGAEEESRDRSRPLRRAGDRSNRRRPAWEAFRAVVGQGFFGGGSRNGITQYADVGSDLAFQGSPATSTATWPRWPPPVGKFTERPCGHDRYGGEAAEHD